MATITINDTSPQAKKFLAYARTLPFVKEGGKDEDIKWTEKMKESFAQAKRGEYSKVDLDNFWDV